MTTPPCPRCNDCRYVYAAMGCASSTGYVPCPECQPTPAKLPDWLVPIGYDQRLVSGGDGSLELEER